MSQWEITDFDSFKIRECNEVTKSQKSINEHRTERNIKIKKAVNKAVSGKNWCWQLCCLIKLKNSRYWFGNFKHSYFGEGKWSWFLISGVENKVPHMRNLLRKSELTLYMGKISLFGTLELDWNINN